MSADAVGGVWTYAVELREALAAEGVQVTIAALGRRSPPQAGVRWRPSRLEWEPGSAADVESSGAWLQEVAAEIGADVVHLNGYAYAALEWDQPTIVAGHSCVLSWHQAVRGVAPGSAWDRYRTAVSAGLSRTEEVVAPTEAMLGSLRRLYGLGHRGRVIHNGVGAGPAPAWRRAPVVLAAGRLWDEAKGLEVLDDAAARLPWPVELAGEAGGGGCPRRATLLGRLPRSGLRQRMSTASIFAHPARYEPFGLVVLEAALGGCALVLGDIPTLRELWDGAAAFVTPGDAEALADTIGRLITRPAERAKLAQLALAQANRYSPRLMACSYASLYQQVRARRWTAA